jgi:hypothetical protein
VDGNVSKDKDLETQLATSLPSQQYIASNVSTANR